MKPVGHLVVLVGLILAGCGTAHDVAVGSYRVVTAPVRAVRRAIAASPEATPAQNYSDVVAPGRPLPSRSPTPGTGARKTAKAKPSPSPTGAATALQFPVAKPVPGRPGLVFSPFDPQGAYIDVSGYAPGSKVKDPDTQKIFIVP